MLLQKAFKFILFHNYMYLQTLKYDHFQATFWLEI